MLRVLAIVSVLFFAASCDAVDQGAGAASDGTEPGTQNSSSQMQDGAAPVSASADLSSLGIKAHQPKPGEALQSDPEGRFNLPGWQSSGAGYWGDDLDDCCVVEFWRGTTAMLVLTEPISHADQSGVQTAKVVGTHLITVNKDEVDSADCRVNGRRAIIGLWNIEKKVFRAVLADGSSFSTHRQNYDDRIGDPAIHCDFGPALQRLARFPSSDNQDMPMAETGVVLDPAFENDMFVR